MKINPIMANRIFKTGTVSATSPDQAVAGTKSSSAPAKMDTISISREGSSQRVFSSIVRDVMRDLEAQDNPARVEELRRAVSEGTYSVPTSAVADAILSRMNIEA